MKIVANSDCQLNESGCILADSAALQMNLDLTNLRPSSSNNSVPSHRSYWDAVFVC